MTSSHPVARGRVPLVTIAHGALAASSEASKSLCFGSQHAFFEIKTIPHDCYTTQPTSGPRNLNSTVAELLWYQPFNMAHI